MNVYLFSLLIAGMLLSLGCIATPIQSNQEIAERWLMMHPSTYLFDGFGPSLKMISQQSLSSGCEEYVYSFQSAHAGYGDRSELILAQVITAHNTTIHVCGGNVSWVNTDGVYDEIRQTDICMMLSAIIEVCGADNKTYQHPCFAKAKGIAISHEGECTNATQLANPASEFCIKNGGTLALITEPNGEVGICTLPNGTAVEEWNYFYAKGNLSAPIACTLEYAPMCGTDGNTYSNTCAAHAAGVAVKTIGECSSTQPPAGAEGGFCGGIAGFGCQNGLFCVLDGDYPDAGGKCVRGSGG